MKPRALELLRYLGKKVDRAFDHLTSELSQNKTILCWVYAAAYLALIFFCVTTNKASHGTAIVTTGSLMGTIFASYVLSASYETVAKYKINTPPAPPTLITPPPDERPNDGAEPVPEREGPPDNHEA